MQLLPLLLTCPPEVQIRDMFQQETCSPTWGTSLKKLDHGTFASIAARAKLVYRYISNHTSPITIPRQNFV
jgi:hypothetical protein